MTQLTLVLPPADLIDFVLEHQGVVSYAQLLERYPKAAVKRWLQEEVLVRQGDLYTLDQLTAYVDGLVLAAWAVPGGIVGKRSALVFHGLTVALPKMVDMSLPSDWHGMLPADVGIRPFEVPAELREYGVMTVFPTPPGSVQIEMYSPAVAVVQVWADPTIPEEGKLDGLMMYRAFREDEEPLLQEAQERYGVTLPATVQIA